MDTIETIGERIKRYRLEKDMTLAEFARMLDCAPQTIYKYENGIVTNIPLNKIRRMASIFGIHERQLVGWEKPEKFDAKLTVQTAQLVIAYNAAPDLLKEAVCRVLGIQRPKQEVSGNDQSGII